MNHAAEKYSASIVSVFLALGMCSVSLSSLARSTPSSSATDAAPAAAETAPLRAGSRIRLFGQNGIKVDFYQNSACYGGKAAGTSVSGGVGDAFSSFFGKAKNTSLGIKDTPNTLDLSKRDGMLSTAYFREYELVPKQPLTIATSFRSNLAVTTTRADGTRFTNGFSSCKLVAGTFTPEAGKDYEAAFDIKSNECEAVIKEVREQEGGIVLQEVQAVLATRCE